MKTEIWKDVIGYEGLYQVSNLGKVKSIYYRNAKILKAMPSTNKYLMVKPSSTFTENNIYREMIPKAKTFFKYLKTNRKKKNTEVIEYIAKHFQCSLGEAEEYLDILREVGARRVLYDMGVSDKEADKLLK
jgi:hypothetical protein